MDGWRRVSILIPQSVFAGRPAEYDRYQEAVRSLALTYDFHGRSGQVDIEWKPSGSQATQYQGEGEPVDRTL